MTSRRISRRDLQAACSEVGELDGRHPRYDSRPGSEKVKNRKALQLCAQVAETLAQVLAGELGDDRLRELRLESVQPAPNAGRLLVTVSVAECGEQRNREQVLGRLERFKVRLRAEVAATIHRRRVPELLFNVVRRSV
jgi:ribosome-binding factor A